MPQPETPTARATADDIPTSVTQLALTAPRVDSYGATPLHLSQNKTAELLAHYWPAIEAHFREQLADTVAAWTGDPTPEEERPGYDGPTIDPADRLLMFLSSEVPGEARVQLIAEHRQMVTGEIAAMLHQAPACRCGAVPVHQMGCDQ